jgi:hypothetical protein
MSLNCSFMMRGIRQIYRPKKVSSNAPMLHQNAVQGPSISHRMGYGGNLPHTTYSGDLASHVVIVRTVDSICTHARPIDEH